MLEALGIYLDFDFCPHSIIPVTRIPEYPLRLETLRAENFEKMVKTKLNKTTENAMQWKLAEAHQYNALSCLVSYSLAQFKLYQERIKGTEKASHHTHPIP